MIGVGDAAASLVGPRIYEEFVWPREKKMVGRTRPGRPRAAAHLRQHPADSAGIGRLGCDLIDIDWLVPLDQARRELGPRRSLSGNIDPVKAVCATARPHRSPPRLPSVSAWRGHAISSWPFEVPATRPWQTSLALRDYVRAVGGGEQ